MEHGREIRITISVLRVRIGSCIMWITIHGLELWETCGGEVLVKGVVGRRGGLESGRGQGRAHGSTGGREGQEALRRR